jgi:hypothetical protein
MKTTSILSAYAIFNPWHSKYKYYGADDNLDCGCFMEVFTLNQMLGKTV